MQTLCISRLFVEDDGRYILMAIIVLERRMRWMLCGVCSENVAITQI
jgi:hypothetical protein